MASTCGMKAFHSGGGIRHDLGNPAGFIPASVEFGLRHPKYDPALFRDLEAIMEKYRPELG